MDLRATSDFGIQVSTLMESAGSAVFEAIRKLVAPGSQVCFLCGRGNNGGDGLVAARLAAHSGYGVTCLVSSERSGLREEAAKQVDKLRGSPAHLYFETDDGYGTQLEALGRFDLLVDALLGTGVSGEVRGAEAASITAANRSGTPILSVDVPSGIDCDSGQELGESIWAVATVTFGLPKPFLFQGRGLEHSGKWTIAPIGFPQEILSTPSEARLIECEWCAGVLPARLKSSHKGDNGHVLIVAGSQSMPGAAAMAASSALRSGAGLVTVAGIDSVCRSVANHLPECIFLSLAEHEGSIAAVSADLIHRSASRFDSAVVGPGIGQSDETRDFLMRLWSGWDIPTVVDADGLNLLMLGAGLPPGECVLTPHPGEMGRLLQASIGEVESNRFDTVREAASRFKKCVLFKGAHTVVAEDGEPIAVNRTGNAGMATGGLGDVLSGVIATLLAQSVPAYHAAILGAFWHGMAGDVCAEEIGAVGYLATEVADALPKARAKIVASCNYEDCCSSSE